MSARDDILRAVRAARPAAAAAAVSLPDVRAAVAGFAPSPGDVVRRFVDAARASGAHLVEGARADVARLVAQSDSGAGCVVSTVPDVAGTDPPPREPRQLAGIDLFACEGVLGVAENGAIWVPASRLGAHRAALFLAAHVAVVLDRAAIVADLHAAYERIAPAAERFGTFVAGPSKTADIEQSLVIGAHGPKRLTILLLRDAQEAGMPRED